MSNNATTAAEVLVKLNHKLGGIYNGSWIAPAEYDLIEAAAGSITEAVAVATAGPGSFVQTISTAPYNPTVGLVYSLTMATPAIVASYTVAEGDTHGDVMAALAAKLENSGLLTVKGVSVGNITDSALRITSKDGSDVELAAFTVA